jgi:hypothetical protein
MTPSSPMGFAAVQRTNNVNISQQNTFDHDGRGMNVE